MTIKAWLRDNWASWLVAILMLSSLPSGLVAGKWLRLNTLLWWAAIGGLVLGLALGKIIRRAALLAGIALISGMLFIVQVQSQALPPFRPGLRELMELGRWVDHELYRTAYEAITRPEEERLPALPRPEMPEWRAAAERLQLYGWNLQADWPPNLAPYQWEKGQVLLGSLLGLLVWITVLVSTWILARRSSTWWALLPTMSLLTLSTYYTTRGWEYLVLCLSAGMLLASTRTQRSLESRWDIEALPYWLRGERWVAAATLAIASSLAMLLAIKVTNPEFQREVHDFLYPPKKVAAGQTGITGIIGTGGTSPGTWPREHLLGNNPELSRQLVMSVRTPGVPPTRFYWRATSYDEYTGHGWLSNASKHAELGAEPLWPETPEPPAHFVLLRQIFRMEVTTSQAYAAGRPVRLSLGVEGVWSDPFHHDLISLNAITPQSAYEALSWIPSSSPDELRAAPDYYPPWIPTYQALPDELPTRIIDLAEETAADAPTAYDKALAIQNYLRENYSYTLELENPPLDQDVVDYFLFDLKQGYCDYYASAMTIMARSVGLPARLAVGYATGTYDPDSQFYQVSQAEAHSWVEIYFSDYGWIAFEPTASRPAIEHGTTGSWVEEAEETSQENIEAFEAENEAGGFAPQQGLQLLALVLVSIVLTGGSIALVWIIGTQRHRQGTPEQIVASLYRDLLTTGRRLGLTLSMTQTPYEFLAALQLELTARAEYGPKRMGDWEVRLEQVNQTANKLVSLYVDMCYSPHQLEEAAPAVHSVLNTWPRFSRAMWMFRLARRDQTRVGSS